MQSSNPSLCSVVLCVRGDVGWKHRLVTVMFPVHGKVSGFRGVKKNPFRYHEIQEPWAVSNALSYR